MRRAATNVLKKINRVRFSTYFEVLFLVEIKYNSVLQAEIYYDYSSISLILAYFV